MKNLPNTQEQHSNKISSIRQNLQELIIAQEGLRELGFTIVDNGNTSTRSTLGYSVSSIASLIQKVANEIDGELSELNIGNVGH